MSRNVSSGRRRLLRRRADEAIGCGLGGVHPNGGFEKIATKKNTFARATKGVRTGSQITPQRLRFFGSSLAKNRLAWPIRWQSAVLPKTTLANRPNKFKKGSCEVEERRSCRSSSRP
eukprot:s432_g5.t1